MSDDHITLRISKRTLLILAVAVLLPVTFVAGISVGRENDSVAVEDSVEETTTTIASTTTLQATTTSIAGTASKKSSPTTVAKKKTTTTTAPLSVKVTYSDNCPAPIAANAGVPGKMTITWTSTSAVRALVEVIHGAGYSYYEGNHEPSDTLVIDRPCNNVKEANGTYSGRPLTVVYRVTVYDAAGKTAVDGGNDSM